MRVSAFVFWTRTLVVLAMGFSMTRADGVSAHPAAGFPPSGAPVTTAQIADLPPDVVTVVLEDPLTGPGVVDAGACSTQRNVRAFVGEGYIFKVTGKCTETASSAGISERLEGLSFPDGEVRVQFKVASGLERAQVRLWFRDQGTGQDGYYAAVEPAHGLVQFLKYSEGQSSVMAEQRVLADQLVPNDWNTLAVRAQGPNFWLLLNDEPVLTAADWALEHGEVVLAVTRLGDINDTSESAVVVRDLRVSGLAEGEQARLPSYQPPAAAPGGEPWIGDIRFGYDRSGAGAVPAGSTLGFVDGGTVYGFFAWRNVPLGSKIGIQYLWGQETHGVFELSPTSSQGRTWGPIVHWESLTTDRPRRSARDFTLIITLNGTEVARGWLIVE
jgi:hypothetical protein